MTPITSQSEPATTPAGWDGSRSAGAPPSDGPPWLGLTAGSLGTSREVEHAVLHILAEQVGPVGSGTLQGHLQQFGYIGSEPTVGRFLRELDRRGLTSRVANRGRTLTEAGHRRLRHLGEAAVQRHYERELIRTIRPTTIDDLLDVLGARRALEREIARLAAKYATAAEIADLEVAIADQRQALAATGVAIEADIRFHTLLAQASRNRVLAAAIDLIRRDQQVTLHLDVILKQTQHHWVVGHDHILGAVKRRAPATAERAMLEHIDSLIADVRRYRDRGHATAGSADETTRATVLVGRSLERSG